MANTWYKIVRGTCTECRGFCDFVMMGRGKRGKPEDVIGWMCEQCPSRQKIDFTNQGEACYNVNVEGYLH